MLTQEGPLRLAASVQDDLRRYAGSTPPPFAAANGGGKIRSMFHVNHSSVC